MFVFSFFFLFTFSLDYLVKERVGCSIIRAWHLPLSNSIKCIFFPPDVYAFVRVCIQSIKKKKKGILLVHNGEL